MTKYFTIVDSLAFYDTLDPGFRLLKAYHINDTAYLHQHYNDIIDLLKYRKEFADLQLCEAPLGFTSTNYIEAYRFTYRAAFCDKSVNLTIGKTEDSIVLDIYLYEVNNRRTICNTLRHIVKQLTKDDWEKLSEGLILSDFWGLEENIGSRGVDGSHLTVTGYQRQVNSFEGNYRSIYRWAGERTAIGMLFKNMPDLSDIKVGCFHYPN